LASSRGVREPRPPSSSHVHRYKREKELDSNKYFESPSKFLEETLYDVSDESQEASERQRKNRRVVFADTDRVCKFEGDCFTKQPMAKTRIIRDDERSGSRISGS
jgi:hypothetical protein